MNLDGAPRRTISDAGFLAFEVAAAMVLLMVLIMSVFQLMFWWHAKAAVDFAAQQGAFAAKMESASPTAGHDAAATILAQTGRVSAPPGGSGGAAVTVTYTPKSVIVEVRGTSPSLAPFGNREVVGRSVQPLERFTRRGDRN